MIAKPHVKSLRDPACKSVQPGDPAPQNIGNQNTLKHDLQRWSPRGCPLALRTLFEVFGLGLEGQVLGLGLEASSPEKLLCPRLEDSTIF